MTRWLLVAVPCCIAAASSIAACSSDDGKPGPTVLPVADAGTEPSDAAADAAPAKKANAEQNCADDSECQSGNCFRGGNQSFCSIPCTAANGATTCIAPFTGACNMKGFCKRD